VLQCVIEITWVWKPRAYTCINDHRLIGVGSVFSGNHVVIAVCYISDDMKLVYVVDL